MTGVPGQAPDVPAAPVPAAPIPAAPVLAAPVLAAPVPAAPVLAAPVPAPEVGGTAAAEAAGGRPWLVSDAVVAAPTEGTAVVAGLLAADAAAAGGVVVSASARPAVSGSHPWLGTAPVPLRLLVALLTTLRRPRVTYLPLGGLSITVLARAALMALAARRPVTLLAVQRYSEPPRWLARPCRGLVRVDVLNDADRAAVERLGLRARVRTPPADPARASREPQVEARRRLGLPLDRPVVLHVGHGTAGRRLHDLAPLADQAEVVLVLSPGTPIEPGAVPSGPGVRVVHERVDVAAWYRAADVYLFPTVDADAVIGVPLSVGEALRNDRPVVARRSPMTEQWSAHPAVQLADDADDLVARARALLPQVRYAP